MINENLFEKYKNSEFLKKLSTYSFQSKSEIIEAYSPFINTADLEHLLTTLTIKTTLPKKLETPFSLTKKSFEIKKIDELEENVIFELEEEESEVEYEQNQDIVCEGVNVNDQLVDAKFVLVKNKVYGLVGPNGIGKSTLLKKIRKRKFGIPGIKIEMVNQEHFRSEKTIIEYLMGHSGKDDETDEMRRKKEALDILEEFGFENPDEKICNLSGGWSCRVRLAKAILADPDLLLLDEPTNMLDLESIFFLQEKIRKMRTVLVVSHDRNFLNEVSDYIIEFENKQLVTYKGSYDCYVKNKKIAENIKLKEFENVTREKEKLKEFIDKFRANASRANLVQSRIKVYEKLILPVITKKTVFSFNFSSTECANVLLDVKNLKFKNILDGVELKIYRESRIVIVGPNGVGKTTLLKCLAGKQECTGDIINSAKIGYFAQQHIENLPYNLTTFQYWVKTTGSDSMPVFKSALSKFGLVDVDNILIGLLSGGQKSRLCFAMINYQSPNLLILDEPTNHLDIDCIEALTDAINNFVGAVLCVSHDMRFVESCFKEIFICNNKKLDYFKGGIGEYKIFVGEKVKAKN